MTLDDLNVECLSYAKELTDRWAFTGWKPGQGNTRLHAQWLRFDEYEGERYHSSLQCVPIELGDLTDDWQRDALPKAKEMMKRALDDVMLFTKMAPEPLQMR